MISKKKFYNFQKIIYHTKKKWKESYWMITCKTYILALMKLMFFGKKMLWIIIIIAIKACVAIDTSKKIKWFIMNATCNISYKKFKWKILINNF